MSATLAHCLRQLQKQAVIAYPTEAVFGLGCDPDSEHAVMTLLQLKQRSIEKGLILVAAEYAQLAPYLSTEKLSSLQQERMFASWPGPVTWVVPAAPHTPHWLTGQFDSLAVRISDHPGVQVLCRAFGKPLVSTSANLSGQLPCRHMTEVIKQFGEGFPVLTGEIGGRQNPSAIFDAISGQPIRQG